MTIPSPEPLPGILAEIAQRAAEVDDLENAIYAAKAAASKAIEPIVKSYAASPICNEEDWRKRQAIGNELSYSKSYNSEKTHGCVSWTIRGRDCDDHGDLLIPLRYLQGTVEEGLALLAADVVEHERLKAEKAAKDATARAAAREKREKAELVRLQTKYGPPSSPARAFLSPALCLTQPHPLHPRDSPFLTQLG